jgi:hypothetical protein
MPNIRVLLILIISLKLSSMAYSQENFQPATLITTNLDTLTGLIDYQNWDKNPDYVDFKTNADVVAQRYYPTSVLKFIVENDVYVGAYVDKENSPNSMGELLFDEDLKLEKVAAFLRVIITGDKPLLYLIADNAKENFYIESKDGSYELLIYKKYLVIRDLGQKLAENKKYLSQLANYLNKCPDIQENLTRVSYTKRSLENAFFTYYKCIGAPQIERTNEVKQKPKVGVLVGVTRTSFGFASDVYPYLDEGHFQPSYDLTMGLDLDIALPRNLGRWSFYNQLVLTSFKTENVFHETVSENLYKTIFTDLRSSYIKISTLVKYQTTSDDINFFAYGGVTTAFLISDTNYRKEVAVAFSQERTTEGPIFDLTKANEVGLKLGMGIKKSRYAAHLNFEVSSGMVERLAGKGTLYRTYLMLGYTL